MLELGKDSKSEHDKIISLAGELNFSHVILSGKFFGSCRLPSYFRWFNNSDETLSWLKNHKPDNASILIKGSRGMKMEKLMEAFSERT
jgi:UDP-N-acetylmuramoyl-tripeptide--D-alanyl-D-alanine ligase